MTPVHQDEVNSDDAPTAPATDIEAAIAGIEGEIRSLARICKREGADDVFRFLSAAVEPFLIELADHLKALTDIAQAGLPKKKVERRETAGMILHHTIQAAISAAKIKNAIGVANGTEDNDPTQPPGEVQAGEDPAQAGTHEHDER